MDNITLIDKMIAEYDNKRNMYEAMYRYYNGDHDINYTYKKFPNRANQIVIDNFVNKFVNEEVQYALGNPLSYVSMSDNADIVNAIYDNTFHWRDTQNQELMRTLEIYGKAYVLHYIDKLGRFSERILPPTKAIEYTDEDDVVQRFIHFYKKKYGDDQYRDVYYPDGTIETYKNNTLVAKNKNAFNAIPVTVCKLDKVEDTIFFKIKELQDAYNEILSDQCNTIADYRNAYLVISGVLVDDDVAKTIKEHGIINLPTNNQTTAKWLVKDMPDGYIANVIGNLKSAMYSNTNHIDGNEKLQSNTSGTALRNRLVFLEQRCNMILDVVIDTVYDRIFRLFQYLFIKGFNFDWHDVKVVASPSIPKDEIGTVQMLTQLGIGENISLETALSLLPFIENPVSEIDKIANAKKNNQKIELDKLDGDLTDEE